MKLSNLLLGWGSKLRIKEHDQLDACVKSVPEWESEAIMPLGSHQMTQILGNLQITGKMDPNGKQVGQTWDRNLARCCKIPIRCLLRHKLGQTVLATFTDLRISERYEVRLNFEIDTRFLMTEKDLWNDTCRHDNIRTLPLLGVKESRNWSHCTLVTWLACLQEQFPLPQDILMCNQAMCPLPEWACSANSSQRLVTWQSWTRMSPASRFAASARPEVYIEEEAAGKDQGYLPFKRSSPLTTVISLWQWKEVAHTKEAEANYIIIYYSYYEPSWNMMNHLKPRNLPDHLYAHQRAATGAFFESLFQRLEPLESKNFASLLPGCNRRVCVYDLVLKFYRVFFLMLFSCLRFSVFLDVWKQITNWIRFFSVSLPVTRQIELQERRMHLASAASGEEGYLEMINDLDTALLP